MPHDPSLPIQERPDYQGIVHVHPSDADGGVLSAEFIYPLFYCEKDTTIDAASVNVANYLVASADSYITLYYNTTLSTTGATVIATVTALSGDGDGAVDSFDLNLPTVNNRVPAGNVIFMVGLDEDPE